MYEENSDTKYKTYEIDINNAAGLADSRQSLGCREAAAGRHGEPARGLALVIRPLDGQHLSGHRTALGHELLDAADRQDGRRVDLRLHGLEDQGPQADPPAQSVDQRLRAVLPAAGDGPRHFRRGEESQLVLPQGRGGEALLLPRVPGRLRCHGRDDTDGAGLHDALHIPAERQQFRGGGRLRPRLIRQDHPLGAQDRRLHDAQQRRRAGQLPQLLRDRLRQALHLSGRRGEGQDQ